MKQTNILCTTITLLIFILLAGCSSTGEQQSGSKVLFPELHGWDLKQVSITDGDTTLDFKRFNCVWVIGDGKKTADEARVTSLVEKLVTIAPDELTAIKSERYNDFKVGDESFTRKVDLTFKDKSSYTLLLGTPAITKPTYLRIAGRQEVFTLDDPVFRHINLDAASWLALEEG